LYCFVGVYQAYTACSVNLPIILAILVVLCASVCAVPVWEELASSLRSTGKTAVIAQIDLTAHSIPQPAGVSILGYPTIYLFRRGAKGRPVEYRGPREVRAFAEFIERHRETNA
jgi:hypothetical protein